MFLDLCSFSLGDQDILLAMVDLSVLSQLLLLFGGAYHNTSRIKSSHVLLQLKL